MSMSRGTPRCAVGGGGEKRGKRRRRRRRRIRIKIIKIRGS
jgi:hypothetical protein